MNPVKPGFQTSEFWATVATQVIAAVSLFYPDLGANVLGKWVQPFAVLAAALATVVYTHSRGKVKTAVAVAPPAASVPSSVEHPDLVKDWNAAQKVAHAAHGTKKAPARKRA